MSRLHTSPIGSQVQFEVNARHADGLAAPPHHTQVVEEALQAQSVSISAVESQVVLLVADAQNSRSRTHCGPSDSSTVIQEHFAEVAVSLALTSRQAAKLAISEHEVQEGVSADAQRHVSPAW